MTTRKGRPAPNGRKIQCCVRLTPDVHQYCQEKGYNVLENAVRETPEFIAWQVRQREAALQELVAESERLGFYKASTTRTG